MILSSPHKFQVSVTWPEIDHHPPENLKKKRTFSRDNRIISAGAGTLYGSSAKIFHGDSSKWNPEELFLAAVSQCHLLTYLYFINQQSIEISECHVRAEGFLSIDKNGIGGEFKEIRLRVKVFTTNALEESKIMELKKLNEKVAEYCFIRRSVACEITDELVISAV